MSRYCLDTNAYSNFKRGHQPVVELIESADWIGLPSIVFGELCVGFEQGNRRERNLAELEEFLAAPVVEFLPAGKQEANIFGSIVTLLKKQGTPIPTNDIWIAAICASAGATLITYDDHFRSVSRIGALVIGLR